MKYVGSKARFRKEILEIVLSGRKSQQYYVEPFAGGMNVISEVNGLRIANDINPYLISMWKELASGWVPKKITKDIYLDVKNNVEKYPPYFVGWVGFNCSYSGKWFDGYAGETETKSGKIRDYQQEAINNVLKQVVKMKGVLLQIGLYSEIVLPQNSIIYCDPPYAGTTGYNCYFDHEVFWDWVRKTDEIGHTVFVSEYNAPPDFECVWEKSATSSLSANGKSGGNKNSIEKLFKWRG